MKVQPFCPLLQSALSAFRRMFVSLRERAVETPIEDLRERIKELTCLHEIRNDVHENPPVEELCPRILEHLVRALHSPKGASLRIELGDQRFDRQGDGSRARHCLAVDIAADGKVLGRLSVFQPVLLPYELDLVDAVAKILARHVVRKEAEEALRKSEQRYRILFETSRDAVLILEPHSWSISSGNRAALEMFGTSDLAELTSARPWELSPEMQPDGRSSVEKAKAMIEVAMREGTHFFEWTHKRLGGANFPATVLLTRLNLGGLVFLQATVRNISEESRAQQSLREGEERLNAVVAAAQDAIIMLDPRGDISLWNPAAARMFGYSAEQAVGRNLHQLLVPERWREDHFRGFREFQRSGTGGAVGRILEVTAVRKGGEEFSAELSLSAVRLQGQWHAVGVLRDITERKATELQREQYLIALEGQRLAMAQFYEAAEAATRIKSQFLANMSHEIRTPMTAILGYAELLAETLQNHEHLDAIDTIRRNGDHLLELINDILDLSRIEAGKLPMERVACSPTAILADVVALMRMRADAKGLALKLEYDGECPAMILTDPTRLRQILINLISNAIKFTQAGEVRIVASLLGCDAPSPKLACEVIDTGIGMSPDQLEGLFQPFQQADGSTSRKFGGSGLGLAISKHLAEMLGGTIQVKSEPGNGSAFTLTVDAGPLSGAVIDPSAKAAADCKLNRDIGGGAQPLPSLSCRVLLAEDGHDNQRLIAFLLTKAGARVTLADNGQVAYEKALAMWRKGDPYDLILMDMQMPVMDGYEATRRLRAEGYSHPIVALTAHAMVEDKEKCLEVGCEAYAAKPIEAKQLIRLVARYTRCAVNQQLSP